MIEPIKRKLQIRAILGVSDTEHRLVASHLATTNDELIRLLEQDDEWTVAPGEAVAFVEFEVEVTLPGIPTVELEHAVITPTVTAIDEAKEAP